MELKTLIGIALIALLCACSDDPVSVAIEKAKAEPNPEVALKIIVDAESAYCEEHRVLGRCSLPERLRDLEDGYFVAAAKAGVPHVLRSLYLHRYTETPLRVELKQMVLEKAAATNDADLLIVAASIAGNESLGPINDEMQLAFLKRAWEAGDAQAAGYLGNIYARSKNYKAAYFWSLRCNAKCRRDDMAGFSKSGYSDYRDSSTLGELEKHLSREVIAREQKVASAGELEKYIPPANARIGRTPTEK